MRIGLAGLALAVATVAAYAPALRAPFQFDDDVSIVHNASIRTLWPLSVPLRPPPQTPVAGRPAVNYTFALNYALNDRLGIDQRPDPDAPNKTAGYHVFNLLLHLLSGALLFGVLRRTLRRQTFDAEWAAMDDGGALLITGIWLLHPIQSEAILYVSQRTELMVGACYLGTLYASIRAWDSVSSRARMGWYGAAIGACVLGMASKEVMVSAPLMIVLYDWAFRRGESVASARSGILAHGRGWFYVALIATTSVLVGLMVSVPRGDSVGFGHGMTWYAYLYDQGWAIPHYVRLALWPNALTADYGGAGAVTGSIAGLLALFAVGVATVVAWVRPRRWGWFGFLGAWFFLILAPSSSIVPVTTEIAAERRMYVALIAVIVVVVIGVEGLRRRLRARVERGAAGGRLAPAQAIWDRAVTPAVVVVLAILGTATYARGTTYETAETLWRDVVKKAPRNPRGYDNLATLLLDETPPRTSEADSLLHRSIVLDSMDVAAWYGLALAALQRDSLDVLVPDSLLRRTVQIDSIYVPALMNLERIDTKEGKLAEADGLLRRVLSVAPTDYVAAARLGVALQQQGQPGQAIPYLEHAVEGDTSSRYMVDLGIAYMDAGRFDAAVRVFRAVLERDPSQEVVLNRVGAALLAEGRAADAIPYLESAVRRQPNSGLSLALLSRAYVESGHVEDATEAATYAGARVGASPEALVALGDAELALGKRDSAIALYRRAIAVKRDYAPARQALGRLTAGPGGP